MKNYGIIVQARAGSTRCPCKIHYEILGKPMLYHQLMRLKSAGFENLAVATTVLENDDITEKICSSAGVDCFRGDVDDVMKRYIESAEFFGFETVIRVGGDDPLIDPQCIKKLIERHRQKPSNLIYASHRKGWIYGTAAELFELNALADAYPSAEKADREHVVTFLRKSPLFTKEALTPEENILIRDDIYLSVDYQEDLDLITQILEYFGTKNCLHTFSQRQLVELYDSGMLTIMNKHLHDGFGD
ncbi:MAG: NTP transferase domain-containing protein [Deferribacterales bacterium]